MRLQPTHSRPTEVDDVVVTIAAVAVELMVVPTRDARATHDRHNCYGHNRYVVAAAAKLASTTAIALGRCNMKADQIMLPSNSHSRASALARKLDLVD